MTLQQRILGGGMAVVVLLVVPGGSTPAIRGDSADGFAAIHFVPRPGEPQRNHATASRLLARAAKAGARVAVLPQLALAGAPRHGRSSAADSIPGLAIDQLGDLAREHRVAIVTSVLERGPEDAYYVSPVLVTARGDLVFHYRKVMPDPEGDDPAFTRGDPAAVLDSVDVGGRRLGVVAGDDAIHGIARLSARGADTVLVTADWSREPNPERLRGRLIDLGRQHGVTLVTAAARPDLTGILPEAGRRVAVWNRGGRETALVESVPAPPDGAVAPLGLPRPPQPMASRSNPELVELGRRLFIDPQLSRDGRVSCATCHRPEQAFSSREPILAGTGHARSPRSVPTLLNVTYRGALFWDGASTTLEHQTKFPMNHAAEMGLPYFDVADRVAENLAYAARFREAGIQTVGVDEVAEALAAYERTLLSGGSAFDRYEYGGARDALTPSAARGLRLFRSKARCSTCHTIGPEYALFSDQTFHNTGIGFDGQQFQDLGLGRLAHGGSRRAGFFLTPSLRNVALTPPYMHDGSVPTLKSAVDYYDRGGHPNPLLDREIRPLGLTREERADLVAFLESLTGEARYTSDGRRADDSASTSVPTVTIAALQLAPPSADIAGRLDEILFAIRGAAAQGARLIVLPEHGAHGPFRDAGDVQASIDAGERMLHGVSGLARDLRVWIVVPLAERSGADGGPRLAMALIDDRGREITRSWKLVPRAELGDGPARPSPLPFVRSVDTPFGRMAVVAGDDLPRAAFEQASAGAALIVSPASWQASDGVDWNALTVSLARTHGVTLAVANLRDGPGARFGAIVGPAGVIARERLPDSRAEAVIASVPTPTGRPGPLGLPPVPLPTRGVQERSVRLGERLFFEPRLSGAASVSCATCHDPTRAFADGRAVAIGVAGRRGTRNVPTLLNAAYRSSYAWDGTVGTLEEHIRRALHDWAEMDGDPDDQLQTLEAIADYRAGFGKVTGRNRLLHADLVRALGDYVRTLVSANSPFDRYYFGQDAGALDGAARRGFELFRGKAQCASCHRIGDSFALFTDDDRHNTGVGYHPRFEYLGYSGHGLPLNLARANTFQGEYVTPSLRNVALTAPYMHDGSLATLDDVVRFYDAGGVPNPFLDGRVRPLGLTADQRRDLVRFLEALTGTHESDRSGPRPATVTPE